MKPVLRIGPKNYASWSMRPWLVLRHHGLPFEEHIVPLFSAPDWPQQARKASPSGRLPVLVDDGVVIHESLAICEHLAERHPDLLLWPAERRARSLARALSCEMATSFGALREAMPMNCRGTNPGFTPSEEVVEDIERIASIWEQRRAEKPQGPFLFGAFGIVDAMYAPVATRLRSYQLQLGGAAGAYADALLDLPALRRWVREGTDDTPIPRYDAALHED